MICSPALSTEKRSAPTNKRAIRKFGRAGTGWYRPCLICTGRQAGLDGIGGLGPFAGGKALRKVRGGADGGPGRKDAKRITGIAVVRPMAVRGRNPSARPKQEDTRSKQVGARFGRGSRCVFKQVGARFRQAYVRFQTGKTCESSKQARGFKQGIHTVQAGKAYDLGGQGARRKRVFGTKLSSPKRFGDKGQPAGGRVAGRMVFQRPGCFLQ